MSVMLVGCVADGNVLVSLDDPSVWTDEGVPYAAHAITNPINFGRATPRGRLRRIGQAVTVGSVATVTVTPLADGDEFEEQAVETTVAAIDGATQIVVVEPAVDGHRLQYRMAASDFDGPVAFGEADLEMIPHRSA